MSFKFASWMFQQLSLSLLPIWRHFGKYIFKNNVSQVVIEIFSGCNRRCDYCPHSLVKRFNRIMDDELFLKIVNDLKKIHYNNYICLNLYNEPLLCFDNLISRMQIISSELPEAKLSFSTNGDFLDLDKLTILIKNNLKRIDVTFHQDKGSVWNADVVIERINKFLVSINESSRKITVSDTSVHCRFKVNGLYVNLFSNNIFEVGFDRGGALKNIQNATYRTKPCKWPIYNFTICYDGTVYPCCQLFHGLDIHAQYQVCNLRDHSIFDSYMHSYLVKFRKMANVDGIKEEECCKKCLL